MNLNENHIFPIEIYGGIGPVAIRYHLI